MKKVYISQNGFNQVQTINKQWQSKEINVVGWAFCLHTNINCSTRLPLFQHHVKPKTQWDLQLCLNRPSYQMPQTGVTEYLSLQACLWGRAWLQRGSYALSLSPFFCSAERSLQTQDPPSPSNTACDNIRSIFTSYKSIICTHTCININVTTQMHTCMCIVMGAELKWVA